jgi:hypothetical protein
LGPGLPLVIFFAVATAMGVLHKARKPVAAPEYSQSRRERK